MTYIVQRLTSLATMFYLLSVVMYIKGRLWARGNRQGAIAYRLLPIAYYFFSLFSALLAMKTKEIAFTLPITIILYEFMFFKSTLKKKLLFLLPIALTLIIIPLSIMGIDKPLGEILSDLSERTRAQSSLARWDYLMTELRVIVTYIRLIFFPINQNLDYDYPVYGSLFTPSVFLSFLFLLSIFGIAVYLLYRSGRKAIGNGQQAMGKSVYRLSPIACCLSPIAHYRLIAFGIFWFFITLSVESSIIPIADVIFEHRVYLPSVGAFIAIAAAVFIFVKGLTAKSALRTAQSAMLILVLILAGAAFARNAVWQDEATLWKDIVEKSPGKARPYIGLGMAYRNKGEKTEALMVYERALRLKLDDPFLYNDLGVTYQDLGRIDDALRSYETALKLMSGFADPYNNIGMALLTIDDNKAIEYFNLALAVDPGHLRAKYNIAVAYNRLGKYDRSIEVFNEVLRSEPDFFNAYYGLGITYEKMGLFKEALAAYRKAVGINRDFPDAHYGLGRLYIASGDYEAASTEYNILARLNPELAARLSLAIKNR